MTSDSWQSQWEKSILTVCEIHGVTNKGHSCSSMLGAALENSGAYRGTPQMGPPPCTCSCFFFFSLSLTSRTYRQTQLNPRGCTLESHKDMPTFAPLSRETVLGLRVTVSQHEPATVEKKVHVPVHVSVQQDQWHCAGSSQVMGSMRECGDEMRGTACV